MMERERERGGECVCERVGGEGRERERGGKEGEVEI
jgi:hypothetical protein